MKTRLCILVLLPLLLAGCGPTRIVTLSPATSRVGTYSTTVTIPRTHTMTTTARVYAADSDISLNLDLQAVSAAFGQASTVEEFENLLNSSSYMISNLDLNEDGYVDYLRVLETVESNAHVFLIQAVLGANIYQDVATVVAEISNASNAYVQIIGAPFIYGPQYIVEPVYIAVPPIFAHLHRPAYRPWRSPWDWNRFPPHYRHPAPIFVSHYHAYVDTYMRNHRYCHSVTYIYTCHYPDYYRVSASYMRNDFGRAHPDRDFAVRTANVPASSIARPTKAQGEVFNARDIREIHDATKVTRTTDLKADKSALGVGSAVKDNSAQSTGRTVVRSAGTGNSVSGNQGAVRQTPGISAGGSTASTTTSQPTTVSRTTINSNRNTANSTARSSSNTTASRQTVTANNNRRVVGRNNASSQPSASVSRQNSQSSGSAVRRTTGTTAKQPSGQSAVRQTPQVGTNTSQPSSVRRTTVNSSSQTTTKSRVSTSGTASTSISTVSPSGSRTTIKRGAN